VSFVIIDFVHKVQLLYCTDIAYVNHYNRLYDDDDGNE